MISINDLFRGTGFISKAHQVIIEGKQKGFKFNEVILVISVSQELQHVRSIQTRADPSARRVVELRALLRALRRPHRLRPGRAA